MNSDDSNRRPLASRSTQWAQWATRMLASTSITPNQVSVASIGAALLGGVFFWYSGQTSDVARAVCLVLAALACQARLLCNLLDGMLAVEAGRQAPDGGVYNELPDRIADILIFAGVGYSIGMPALGWAAASFAVLTAYVRELGHALGEPADFSGPMAKQHRMALLTVAVVLSLFEPLWGGDQQLLHIALWVIIVGSLITTARRAWRLVTTLRNR